MTPFINRTLSGMELEVKRMFSKEEVKELLDELLEEEALLIGGNFAMYQVEDDFIWKLMKGLDQIRDRFIARIEDMSEDSPVASRRLNLTPHPAIEHFLLKLKRNNRGNQGAAL